MKIIAIALFVFAYMGIATAQDQPFPPEKGWYNPLKKDAEAPSLFDLEKEVALNKELEADLQAHNYSYGLLAEYLQAYHSDTRYTWYETAAFFGYLGMRYTERQEREMLYVYWQSYSDGLEWAFGEECYLRAAQNADPYSIIANESLRKLFKRRFKKQAPADVFLLRRREVVTEQQTSNIAFPKKEATLLIGILPKAGGEVLYFNEKGARVE